MKRIIFLAAALMIGAPAAGNAQIAVDMNQMTCANFLGYSPENQQFVRFWMSGYYNAASNSSVLNYDRLQKNSAKIVSYCKKHRKQTLPTAIKNAAK